MTTDYCCECGKEVHINESFQLKVMSCGEIWWCLRCAGQQLKIIDMKIAEIKKKKYGKD